MDLRGYRFYLVNNEGKVVSYGSIPTMSDIEDNNNAVKLQIMTCERYKLNMYIYKPSIKDIQDIDIASDYIISGLTWEDIKNMQQGIKVKKAIKTANLPENAICIIDKTDIE